jgi:DNA replication protein DnaC
MTGKIDQDLRKRAHALGLHGLLARWDEHAHEPWLRTLLDIEEAERQRRSLERRLAAAKLIAMKPIVDFDWKHPKSLDRGLVDELFELQFLRDHVNIVLLGPNGVGKTMLAQNLAHHAVMHGFTARFTTASAMLGDLDAQDGAVALRRRLHRYVKPALLVIDELGYLPYTNRYADLLFEVVTQRYMKAPIVITTNRPFSEWAAVFQSATCVGTLLDRLCHRVEIVQIAGESWRLKEANERSSRRRPRPTRTTS